MLARETASGGSAPIAHRDFVYSPTERAFVRQHESDEFAPRENTLQINGGTSDEYQYNNSESQTPANRANFNFGESISTDEAFFGPIEEEGEVGDDSLGASGEFRVGAGGSGTAAVGFDGSTAQATASAEFFAGVDANAEGHAELGPVAGDVEIGGLLGASGSVEAGLSFDRRNGVSGQVGGELFAGAQINLEAGASLGDSIEASAGLDLKAGIGIEASGEIEFGLEEIGIDVEIGAALGLGADVSIDISISPLGIIDDIGDTLSAARDFFGW